MTNVERNLQTTIRVGEIVQNGPISTMHEKIKIVYLEDISKSLASIADSLERLAPREHEDLN